MYKYKKCESNEYIKAGFVKDEQRYKCKKCGCLFPQDIKTGANKKSSWRCGCYAHGYSSRLCRQ